MGLQGRSTSSVIRLAGDRRTPPSPEGEGYKAGRPLSLPPCVRRLQIAPLGRGAKDERRTSSVIRLAGDRRMPPSPEGEGYMEGRPLSLPPCVRRRQTAPLGRGAKEERSTSSVIRLAGDRRTPPSPEGEGYKEGRPLSLPPCVRRRQTAPLCRGAKDERRLE